MIQLELVSAPGRHGEGAGSKGRRRWPPLKLVDDGGVIARRHEKLCGHEHAQAPTRVSTELGSTPNVAAFDPSCFSTHSHVFQYSSVGN